MFTPAHSYRQSPLYYCVNSPQMMKNASYGHDLSSLVVDDPELSTRLSSELRRSCILLGIEDGVLHEQLDLFKLPRFKAQTHMSSAGKGYRAR